VLPRGSADIGRRLHAVIEKLPQLLQFTLVELVSEIAETQDKLRRLDKTLKQQVEQCSIGQQQLAIPGIGPTIASAALGGSAVFTPSSAVGRSPPGWVLHRVSTAPAQHAT
jgi:transposase